MRPAFGAPAVRAAVVAVLAVALAGLGGLRPAGAQEQARLEAAKRAGTAAVTRRVLALRALTTPVKATTRVSDSERAELATQLQEQINGLTSLTATIQGASDEATLRATAQRIITDYRVYVLTVPKVRGVVVADLELLAAERLTQLADRLSATIDQAQVQGEDTTQASADLATLRARLAAVTAAVSPLPAVLLALEPAGYPDNHPALDQTRQALRTGRANLADAAHLARAVITDLK